MPTQKQSAALDKFYAVICDVSEILEAAFLAATPYHGRAPDSLLAVKPFSAMLASYEAVLETGLSLSAEEINEAIYTRNMAAPRRVPLFRNYELSRIIARYCSLPESEKDRARERSDELMATKPSAGFYAHELVWRRDTPVHFLNPDFERSRESDVFHYQFVAYGLGHDTAAQSTYGYYVLMLLNVEQLSRALELFKAIEPSGDPRALSELADFKRNSMTPEIFLDALAIGYSSREQLKAAAKIIGITSWNRKYFQEIFSRGSELAAAAQKEIMLSSQP